MDETAKAQVQAILDGVTAALNDDGIQTTGFEFYHLLPNNHFVATAIGADDRRIMAMSNLATGDFAYSDHDPAELAQIQGRIQNTHPGAKLKWIGDGQDGEFAVYVGADGKLGSLGI
jgi:hypothetical protein